jgi:drug/metabolite transporter (DMT)-like permease
VGGLVTCFHLQLWTLVGFAVAVALTGPQLPGSAVGWSAAFVNGVLNAAVFLAFFVAVRLIGASRATMYGVLEPIAAILLAIWLFDEWLSPLQWLGVALVAAGMFFMEATFGRKAAPADAG